MTREVMFGLAMLGPCLLLGCGRDEARSNAPIAATRPNPSPNYKEALAASRVTIRDLTRSAGWDAVIPLVASVGESEISDGFLLLLIQDLAKDLRVGADSSPGEPELEWALLRLLMKDDREAVLVKVVEMGLGAADEKRVQAAVRAMALAIQRADSFSQRFEALSARVTETGRRAFRSAIDLGNLWKREGRFREETIEVPIDGK